jgi:glutamate--cysteine ligase
MAAGQSTITRVAADLDERLADPSRAVAAARDHIQASALRGDPAVTAGERRVGLELEFHLVDLAQPALRPSWGRIEELLASVPDLPSRSAVTVEPGGQVELSTPPTMGVAAAVAGLEADRKVLGAVLADAGLGAAPLGTDIARTPRRVNPASRYAAMEAHFTALRCARAGIAMMAGTAALQINLDAGPAARWSQRLAHFRRLSPVLVAMSACSPLLGGHSSGWHSMRQEAWYGIDARRGRLATSADPTAAWATYALDAPVMLVRTGGELRPVTDRIPLSAWLDGSAPLGRRPTVADVDYHLTTLFPPIRPRGYVELRCLDAVPDRWWPGLAALVVTLVEDPQAADHAAELCEPVQHRWLAAARSGLADARIGAAARGCAEVAARRCPPELRAHAEAYAELIAAGRTPGDDVRDGVRRSDPLTVLAEHAHV